MAPSAQAHQRSHSMLLLQKLLNLRDSASPLTLIIDSLEQTARPVLNEFITRAKFARSKVIFISLATVKKPPSADILIKARGKPLRDLSIEITSHLLQPPPPAPPQKYLLLLDTLHPLLPLPHLPTFLQSILPSPLISLVAVYHADVPVPAPTSQEYAPAPLTFLSSLATTTIRVSSLAHEVAARQAQRRSLPVPEHGLREGREGGGSVVLDVEMRRRSGRAVGERFVMTMTTGEGGKAAAQFVMLGDHPLFVEDVARAGGAGGEGKGEEEGAETTFSLGLTEKQRRDREGVVLPYFDAQTDMGREDDFDDEEDEI
ncbi:Elongator complex protein 5 [Schizothecium vesticola]|uniref:Elongator complex protein 5 n=1 Tax=Schizothecium vesticola TaxID=314040 RepID=A0AA40FBQ0_9PEZI|nr:Elongator complex protein 5 [Schizothecium vesticola]